MWKYFCRRQQKWYIIVSRSDRGRTRISVDIIKQTTGERWEAWKMMLERKGSGTAFHTYSFPVEVKSVLKIWWIKNNTQYNAPFQVSIKYYYYFISYNMILCNIQIQCCTLRDIEDGVSGSRSDWRDPNPSHTSNPDPPHRTLFLFSYFPCSDAYSLLDCQLIQSCSIQPKPFSSLTFKKSSTRKSIFHSEFIFVFIHILSTYCLEQIKLRHDHMRSGHRINTERDRFFLSHSISIYLFLWPLFSPFVPFPFAPKCNCNRPEKTWTNRLETVRACYERWRVVEPN